MLLNEKAAMILCTAEVCIGFAAAIWYMLLCITGPYTGYEYPSGILAGIAVMFCGSIGLYTIPRFFHN